MRTDLDKLLRINADLKSQVGMQERMRRRERGRDPGAPMKGVPIATVPNLQNPLQPHDIGDRMSAQVDGDRIPAAEETPKGGTAL
jgi:hypothetical protein